MANALTENVKDAVGATPLDPENYFEVQARMWDPKANDYTIELAEGKGSTPFREFPNANNYFLCLEYTDLCTMRGDDIRLEVLHMRMGTPHRVRSRILFPR